MAWRASRVGYAAVAALADGLPCPEPLAWTLVRRGISDVAAAREFLEADGPFRPPDSIPGIIPAADRLLRAIAVNERIVVHGDYDCDGIVSTALLVRALRARGADVGTFLPNRFTDGYGVALGTVERLAAEGAQVLVCVDCGTTAVEALTRAAELGIEAIVVDHHLAGGHRAPAILANPALGRPADDLPAAAGVVLKLTQAMAERAGAHLLGLVPEDDLDLVALATVADAVPLVGENRRLVARGLRLLRDRPRPGIRALCRAAETDPRSATARTLGFTLAPAINAAGRLSHPDRALEVLLADDEEAAAAGARDLWELNMRRRDVEREITQAAVERVEALALNAPDSQAIVVAGDGWHEGVVGIVASRLVDRYARPAVVISIQGDVAKGSGRSVPGVDLHALVAQSDGTLVRWGGHAGAVGLQLAPTDVPRFRAELGAAAEGMRGAIDRARVRTVDAVVSAGDLGLAAAEAFERLEPFGRGNPAARLVVPGARTGGSSQVGDGRHLRVRLLAGGANAAAIGFGLAERGVTVDPEGRYDAVVGLEVDRWQELVGPKVVLHALEPLPAGADDTPVLGPAELGVGPVIPLTGTPPDPPDASPPLGVRDRRGAGALAQLVALAGADGGAVAIVADAGRRAIALESTLRPGRLGIERVVVAPAGVSPAAVTAALADPRGGALLALIDYELLPAIELPRAVHVVALDPPAAPWAARWLRARAAGHFLHLCFGPDEVAFAARVAERRFDLRAAAAALWRPMIERGSLSPAALAALTISLGIDPASGACAIAALGEIGLVRVDATGAVSVVAGARGDLAGSPLYVLCRERAVEAREFLARAQTLDLEAVPAAALPG